MKTQIGFAVLVVGAVASAYLVGRLKHRPAVMIYDGTSVPDLSPSEASAFAGPEYAGVRQVYLANLELYRRWAMQPISKDPRLTRLSLPSSFAELDNLDDLFCRIGIVLGRASGMSLAEYKTHLAGAEFVMPEASGCCANWKGQTFESLYEAAGKEPRLISFAKDVTGVRAAAGTALPEDSDNLLLNALSRDERDYTLFRGPISQSAIIFHQHPDMAAIEKQKLRFVVLSVIVEDDSGDRFPVWMSFFHEGHRWWMCNVYRMVSVRVAAREKQLVY